MTESTEAQRLSPPPFFSVALPTPSVAPTVHASLPERIAHPPAEAARSKWEAFASRSLDLSLALIALVILSPLLLLIALSIRMTSEGPALFKQPRVGRDRQNFTCYKFRTMVPVADGDDDAVLRELIDRQLRGEDTSKGSSWKAVDSNRITPVGSLLRKTSLDELPQLFNVVNGSMSLVGPRPMLEWQCDAFPREYDDRFSVRPGITGLWQVSGRSKVSTLEMLRLDVFYVHRQSLMTDLGIIFRTIPTVLRGDGSR